MTGPITSLAPVPDGPPPPPSSHNRGIPWAAIVLVVFVLGCVGALVYVASRS